VLPEAAAAWTSLITLNLLGNRLAVLPEAAAAWTSLTTLKLYDKGLPLLWLTRPGRGGQAAGAVDRSVSNSMGVSRPRRSWLRRRW
jgi:hypothetical protein